MRKTPIQIIKVFRNNLDIILVNLICLVLIAYLSTERNLLKSPAKITIYISILLFLIAAIYNKACKFISSSEKATQDILKDIYNRDNSKFVIVYNESGKLIYANEHLKKILGTLPRNIHELLNYDCFNGKVNTEQPLNDFSITCLDKKLKSFISKIESFECEHNKYRIFEFYKNFEKSYLKQALDILEKFEIPAIICNESGIIIEQNAILLADNIINSAIDLETVKHGNHISLGKDKLYKAKILTVEDCKDLLIVLFPKSLDSHEIWAFLKRSTLGAAIIDMDFNIIRCNEPFYELTGSHKNPEGQNFLSFLDIEDKIRVTITAQDRLQDKQVGPVEINLKVQEKTFVIHINKIEFAGNLNYIFSVIDITKYKTLEMNFVHSQKMQAVGQLAGAIAHDFNNLLTAMIGFCDLLLLRHPPGDRSFGELMQIKQNVNRAANLVRQLLAFSRKQVLQPNILEITNILAEISNLISRLIGENIELQIEHGQNLDYVKVDQGQLEQVIINLAINARDAMPNGGILKISTYSINVDTNFDESQYIAPAGDENITHGDYVLIEISDNGCGIPKKVLDKIFEPFFSTKAIGAGTGLGLSTAYGIVKQTGGYIRLKTSENKGTTFFIFLKAAGRLDELEKNEFEHSLDDIPEKSSSHNFDWIGKILVVEDENPVRIFSAHALTTKGYEVLEADCADTALNIMANEGEKIKMIITDVMMPGMTGPKMIEEIHKNYPNIKVIYISGYAEDALNTQSLNNEFHFLPKPFTLKQLANKVKEVIMT